VRKKISGTISSNSTGCGLSSCSPQSVVSGRGIPIFNILWKRFLLTRLGLSVGCGRKWSRVVDKERSVEQVEPGGTDSRS
jgi:hypothetical protein